MDLNTPRPRINGAMFPDFQSKNVTVLGMATETDHMGTSFQLMTSDNYRVTVRMGQPLQELITGLIEVHGVVRNQREMHCNTYILLNDGQNFDMEGYDKAVKLIHQHPDHYITAD